MCEAHLQCWRVRVQSVVHWIWVDVIPGWLGHSFTHLSRFVDIFRSALRHCFTTSRRLVLIAVSAKSPFLFFLSFPCPFFPSFNCTIYPYRCHSRAMPFHPVQIACLLWKIVAKWPLENAGQKRPERYQADLSFFIAGCTRTVPNLIFEWDGW